MYKLILQFFLSQGHFLMRNWSYVYKEDDFSQEEFYLKKRLVTLFKELGYVEGIILQDETLRKCSKWLKKAHMLIDSNTNEERRVIFGKLVVLLTFFACHLCLKCFQMIYQLSYAESMK